MASYDCGIDQIYHSVKQVFPEDSDLFNYSVLLLPSSSKYKYIFSIENQLSVHIV